jgi:hypothetical protein
MWFFSKRRKREERQKQWELEQRKKRELERRWDEAQKVANKEWAKQLRLTLEPYDYSKWWDLVQEKALGPYGDEYDSQRYFCRKCRGLANPVPPSAPCSKCYPELAKQYDVLWRYKGV